MDLTDADDAMDVDDGDWGEAWDRGIPSTESSHDPGRAADLLNPRSSTSQNTAAASQIHRQLEHVQAMSGKKPVPAAATNSTATKTGTQPKDLEENQGPSGSKHSLVSRLLLNDNKAGMEGLDREKINQIIYEASKGSRYFENEQKKEEQVNKKIQEQAVKMSKLTLEMIQQATATADELLNELESKRDLTRTIVHVDMDMFYAAVEMRDRPELRDMPMAVGGNDMLSTSNYVARRFGVRAAMPGFIGRKLCPNLVIVPLNFDKYKSVSEVVRGILVQYDAGMCPMSLDEAYLDITDHVAKRDSGRTFTRRLTDSETCGCSTECSCGKPPRGAEQTESFGASPEEAVREMRFRIHQETQLTASAGIASNMMLAKVCSDKNKPNGQCCIPATRQAIMDFVKDLPIRKISGIGKVSEKMLSAIGVRICSDLYEHRGLLRHLYSNISTDYFMRICLGIGSTRVDRDGERKSMSTERTFSEISKPVELYKKCHELCAALADDLKKEQLVGKTVTLKLKLSTFESRTRSHTVLDYTNEDEAIYSVARDILRQEIHSAAPGPLRLRLMGVRMSNLLPQNQTESQKQVTITGLFKRIQGRNSPSTSPVKGQGRVLDDKSPNTSPVKDQGHIESSESLDNFQTDFTTMFEHNGKPTSSTVPGCSSFGQEIPSNVDEREADFIFGLVSHRKDDLEGLRGSSLYVDVNKMKTAEGNDSPVHVSSNKPLISSMENNNVSPAHVPSHTVHAVDNKPSTSATEDNKPSTSATEDNKPNTSATKDNKPSKSATEDNKPCTSATDDNKPCTSATEDTKPCTSVTEDNKPSTSATDNNKPSKSATKDDADSKNSLLECPVCFKTRSYASHSDFTSHMDECLARKCVEEDKTEKTNEEPEIFICPICNAPQRSSSLPLFNQHVDSCLNRQAIKEIIQDNNGNTVSKRSPSACSSGSTPKRQKLGVSTSKPTNSTKGTLHKFFASQQK